MTYFAGSGKTDPLKFVYMNIKKQKRGPNDTEPSPLDFNPYELEVVPRERTDPEHYMISVSGVVHITPSKKVLRRTKL